VVVDDVVVVEVDVVVVDGTVLVLDVDAVVVLVGSGPSSTDVGLHDVSIASIPAATRRDTGITTRLQATVARRWQRNRSSAAATPDQRPATISAISSPASVGF